MRGVNSKSSRSEVYGRSNHTAAVQKKPEEKKPEGKKPEEKKPQLKVHEDGSMAGRLGRTEDGKVRVGGLTLKQPADGEVVTHRLSDNQLLVLRGEGNTVSVSTRKLGLEINEKGKLKGLVAPREVDGKKVVDLGPLGTLLAPAPGGTDSYLMAPDKLLVLKNKDDGTVEVYTRTLGIEGDKKGNFQGDVLPVDGRVEFDGHKLDVGHLKPGEERSEKIKIKGKKYEVKLRMNADGSVTVSGERKKSFWSKLGGVLSFVAPVLAALPGLGWGALLAKAVSGFNAVKNGIQAARNGDFLGLVSSVAGGLTNFSQGAFKAAASMVANVTSFGQQVIGVFKHGLGSGLLPVVSSLTNLASGAAGAVAGLGQGATRATAGQLAANFGNVARATSAVDEAIKGNLMPGLGLAATAVASNIKRPAPPKEEGSGYTIRKDIKFTPYSEPLPSSDPTRNTSLSGFAPNGDTFVGSSGTNISLGNSGADLVAQLTPQQDHLLKGGSRNHTPGQLKNAIEVGERYAYGFFELNQPVVHDRGVNFEELKAGYKSYKAAGGDAAVLSAMEFLLKNFSAIAFQSGDRRFLNVGDIEAANGSGIFAKEQPGMSVGGAVNKVNSSLGQAVDTRSQVERMSGGGINELPRDGKVYRNGKSVLDRTTGETFFVYTSDDGGELRINAQSGKETIYPPN
jgi:hypothetical protein